MRNAVGLVSVGYGGRRVRDLVDALKLEGVDVLVDVRLTPRSGVPGFSGSALRRVLGEAGIEYRHEGSLGNQEDNRAGFHEGKPIARRRFQHVLDGRGRASLEWLSGAVARQRVAVLCAERDEGRCHRQEIIAALVRLNPALAVTRLG